MIPLLVLLSAGPVSAETTGYSYLAAFHQGRYQDAAAIADTARSADEFAFAARALLAQGMSGDAQPPEALLQDAERLARRALADEPRHIEGRLQLAIALSLQMRPMSTREAQRTGQASLPKELALAVLEDDPDNAYAHGLLAVWNIEVVRRGGRIGAAIMGASLKGAGQHYRAAVAASPGDASIHWQYARALAQLNVQRNRDEIDAAIAAGVTSPLDNALEQTMAERCARLKHVLLTDGADEAEALAAELL